MLQSWQDAYMAMKEYIFSNKEIVIEPARMQIPDCVRAEFYSYFDALSDTFIKEEIPDILRESESVSDAYIQAEHEVTDMLELDEVTMMPGLDRFLHDPIDQLRRCLYDTAFDLLKGKIQIPLFIEESNQKLDKCFAQMYPLAYAKWVETSLIKLLEADELLHVTFPEVTLYDAHKSGGIIKEKVPHPDQSRCIDFEFAPDTAANIADWVIRSTVTGQYVSARSQFGEPFGVAVNASEAREWLPMVTTFPLDEGILLLNHGKNASEISLFSDANRICRPDILIVCDPFGHWLEEDGLEKIQTYRQSLKPILGTFLILKEVKKRTNLQKTFEGIQILEAELEQLRLAPIIEAMMK
jgi:hypothetical protein